MMISMDYMGSQRVGHDQATSTFHFDNQMGFPCHSAGKESSCNVGDLGSIPGLGRSPGEWKGYPLQYSGLENPRDGGAWWAAVYGVAQSQTRLKQLSSSSIYIFSISLKLEWKLPNYGALDYLGLPLWLSW